MVEAGKAEFCKREEWSTPDYANETIPEIKTKEGGRKSTIRKVKCLNSIARERCGLSTTRSQKGSAF